MPGGALRRWRLPAGCRWIWAATVAKNSTVAALKTVALPAVPHEARLAVFADTKYKLYVNGRFVNAGPAPFRKPVIMVDEYDVAPFLRRGRNTILILAHFVGSDTKYNLAEKPGLLAAFEARLPGGRHASAVSDASWRVAPLDCWRADAPRRNWAIEHMEDVDLAHPGFAVLCEFAGEDYAAGRPRRAARALWGKPAVTDRPDLELRARMVPPLRWSREDVHVPRLVFRTNTERYSLQDTAIRLDHEHVWPERDEAVYEMTRNGVVQFERREGEPGFGLVYDMRRMCAGDPAVEIECAAPCTVEVALAEALRTDGHPVVWRNGGLYYARYHLAAGTNRVRFYHFNGHRYLYLVMKDAIGAVEVRRVTTHHCRADLEFHDGFDSEDREAESLYRISRRSLMLNSQANPYDCNTREQGTYWGDGVWIVDTVGHQTGDFRPMRQLCYAMSDEVRACGPLVPASLYGMGAPLYDYCLVPLDLLERYYRYTGDRATVAANLPAARRIVDAFRGFKDKAGLLSVGRIPAGDNAFRKGLLFLDHPGNGWHSMTTTGIDRRDPNAGFNLYYLQALQALAALERACGTPARLGAEIEAVARAVRAACWVPAQGLVADAAPLDGRTPRFSQLANALAITTGVLQGAQARQALAAVLDIPRHPWVSQGTPYSYFFLAEAAARTGMAAEAVRAFTRDFAGMLDRGATTTWEAWRGENHDSLNHAWSAPLPYLIRRGVMGLAPEKPGYAAARLQPCFEAFDRFRAVQCVPAGEVSVAWDRISPAAVQLTVEAPPRMPLAIVLPRGVRRVKGAWSGRVALAD